MADPWDKKPRGGGNPLDQAAQNIQAIRSYVKQMRTLAEDFDTEYDTQELRDRLHAGRRATAALAKETTNLLKTPSSDRSKQDKLKRDLQSCVADFEKMSQEHRRMEREILVRMEEEFSNTYQHAPELGDYEEEDYDEPEQRGRTRTKLQLELADGLEDVDCKIIQERNREVQMLDQEMEEVVDLFQEVNSMVSDQGEKLDQADERVAMTEKTVHETEAELSKFYRCCWCCCVKRK